MKYLYIFFEIIMFGMQIFAIRTMTYTYSNANFNVPPIGYIHPLESTGVIITFIVIPIFLCLFTVCSMIFQIIKNYLYDFLFGLIVSASLILALSWLMHGIPLYSFLLSLVSFALCSFGFTKMWISRKIKSVI